MIFTTESAVQQATNLLHLYNGLKVFSIDEVQITLIGNILVNRTAKGYRLLKEYKIKIVIPLGSDELPRVLDEGNQIDKNYPHRYPDGELCLETDTNIRFRFIDGFSLDAWMSEYVETYFFRSEEHTSEL